MNKKFTLTSTAFKHQQPIPSKYTCDGEDISPALAWHDAPAETKSFALIVDDPDAPHKTFVHWILFNIPATTNNLAENLGKQFESGITDYQRRGYGGPCPPSGVHRYFFKIYALDTLISVPEDATKEDLLKAMENHILASAELIGLYKRNKL